MREGFFVGTSTKAAFRMEQICSVVADQAPLQTVVGDLRGC